MAEILNYGSKRKTIKLSTDDVIDVVREYLRVSYGIHSYDLIRQKLNKTDFYIPED